MSAALGDLLDVPRELHRRAVHESNALRPLAAARLLRRALDALSTADGAPAADVLTLQTQIAITRARVESELHGTLHGLQVLDEAVLLSRSGADRSVMTALHNQRGLLLLRVGNAKAAVDEFDRAEEFFDTAPPVEQANILLNRGTAAMALGDLHRTGRDLARCAGIAKAHGLRSHEYMSRHNYGYLQFLRGDLPNALRAMDEAALAGEVKSIGLLDRARVLMEAGLTREADDALAEAARLLRRDRMSQDLGETELERARCALVAGDVRAARRFAAHARDRFRRRGADSWRRAAELVLLQGDLAAGRPGARLIEPALRLRAELEADGLRLASRTAGLLAAEAALSAGAAQAATDLLGSLSSMRPRDPVTVRLHDRYVAARLADVSGRRTSAQRLVRAGLAELAAYQASFGSVDLQTAAAVHGRLLGEFGVEIALRAGRPHGVFDAAERARAVSTRLPTVRPPSDEQTAELMTELRQTVESLRAVEQDRAASAPLLRRRRELERDIAARRWTLTGSGDARRVARLDEVSGAVAAAGSAMVVFLSSGGVLHAVLVRAGAVRVLELGATAPVAELVHRVRADLDVLAQPRLPAELAGAVRRSLIKSLAALDGLLIKPGGIGETELVVVSTGLLGQVPWGMFPSLRGVPVVLASSATSWLAARDQQGRAQRRGVAALSGPDLARADLEVAGVGAAWPSASVEHGGAAIRSAFTRAMAKAGIVHVAAHGTHQTENPMFSSLRLADGVLFAHELDQTTRTPDHVILSACELGLATVRPGDEALGLTSVLLRLGTRSVVAGVARVGDQIAADTMIDYHRRLAAGADSASALAAATADRIAPFVCFGSTWKTWKTSKVVGIAGRAGFGSVSGSRVP